MDNSKKLILTMTGGGTKCVPDLMAHVGASSEVESINIPYGTKSTSNFLKRNHCMEPKSLFSYQAALSLLAASVNQASYDKDCYYVACTCSLNNKKDEPQREGRVNGYHMAGMTAKGLYYMTCTFNPDINRQEQENRMKSEILGFCSHISRDEQCYEIQRIITAERSDMFDILATIRNRDGFYMYSGSFNPWHEAHDHIASYKFDSIRYGGGPDVNKFAHLHRCPELIEISKNAVGKTGVTYLEDRLATIPKKFNMVYSSVIPRFVDKHELLSSLMSTLVKNCCYSMGSDTYTRLTKEELDILNSDKRVVLVVFMRAGADNPTYVIDNVVFRDNPHPHISSTKIRQVIV